MDNTENRKIIEQLDEIIILLKMISKPPSAGKRVLDGIATGAGIMGIISVIDVLRGWFGG
ncbi:MAG: hypothetical protein FWG77_08340 [Treponema sp.]|nr:hypothetical protein [Treponema sp.]